MFSDHTGQPEFEQFRDYLLIVARTMIGPAHRGRIDPDDLVNQTLFDAFRERGRLLASDDGQVAAWLRQMLENNLRDTVRYLHRDKRDVARDQTMVRVSWNTSGSRLMQLTAGLTSPSGRAMRNETDLLLAAALMQLPGPQREAIELHHLQGCTLAETAELLDRSFASVAGLLRRGLKRLREILEETGATE
jgi:RNA polymerase sigma-70 factor, ECF subfamily